MTVPFHGDGIISQFEGYERLPEFDWEGYRERYGNITRLDRILEAEGDSPDRYKLSKQADVLMLFYLFPPEEVRRMLEQLGYPFPDDALRRTVECYLPRTSHGSTLSYVVHASVLDLVRHDAAWEMFTEALRGDVEDIQGGTTREGVHLGAIGGTVDIVFRHFVGLDATGDVIAFRPRLPEALSSLRAQVRHRGRWFGITVTRGSVPAVRRARRRRARARQDPRRAAHARAGGALRVRAGGQGAVVICPAVGLRRRSRAASPRARPRRGSRPRSSSTRAGCGGRRSSGRCRARPRSPAS